MISEMLYTPFPHTLEIEGNDLTLKIGASKKPGCILVFFFIIALLTFLAPIIAFVSIVLIACDDLSFGFIFAIIICWGIAFFIFRLYCWNRYGTEVFSITDNVFESYHDFKYFKDNRKQIKIEYIDIYYNSGIDYYDEDEAEELGIPSNIEDVRGNFPIRFFINNDVIDSAREIPIEVIRKIKERFDKKKISTSFKKCLL